MQKPSLPQRIALQSAPASPVVMRQSWKDLLFAHWSLSPDIVQRTLPTGLTVDTHEDRAWIGIVPFFMQNVRPSGLPSLPWISNFLELNVRTYVHDEHGTPGVWFYSLDCNQPIAVWIARTLFHLNYRPAFMNASRTPAGITYSSRLNGESWTSTFQYRPTTAPEHATPGSLEFFLVERYLLFSQNRNGRIFSGRVHHPPYKVSGADVQFGESSFAALSGFSDLDSPPAHLCCSAGVDVRIFPLAPHKATSIS